MIIRLRILEGSQVESSLDGNKTKIVRHKIYREIFPYHPATEICELYLAQLTSGERLRERYQWAILQLKLEQSIRDSIRFEEQAMFGDW